MPSRPYMDALHINGDFGQVKHFVAPHHESLRNAPVDNVGACSYIISMKTIGIRELKNRLSEFVREVRSGEAVLVTDRGEVVAELVPPGESSRDPQTPPALAALVKSGQVTVGISNDAGAYPKLPRLVERGHAARLLNEERGNR